MDGREDERRFRPRDAVTLLAILVMTMLATGMGTLRGTSIVFNLGPNDSSYLSGFVPSYEIADAVLATRWTTYDAFRFGLPIPEGVPTSTQERAYTSPIWYSP